MKQENESLFGKAVRNLCDSARSCCRALEAVVENDGVGSWIDLRGLTLWLINAIRELIARLLAEETLHREALDALASLRDERDTAFQELRRQLRVFRQLDLSDGDGALIPSGGLPRRADELTALAAAVHPRLDGPDLELPPWLEILPDARQNLGWATMTLAAAASAVEKAEEQSGKTREVRAATMSDLRVHVTAARSLHQALCDLRALSCGSVDTPYGVN